METFDPHLAIAHNYLEFDCPAGRMALSTITAPDGAIAVRARGRTVALVSDDTAETVGRWLIAAARRRREG